MSANIRESIIAFGYKHEAALGTTQVAGDMWSLTKTNSDLLAVDLQTEDDGQDIGKGDEFPTQTFLTNWDVQGTVEKYVSSEALAWAGCFGLGKTTKTTPASGAYTYTCTPQDPITDDIDMKSFTMIEQIRPSVPYVDRALSGCVLNGFNVVLGSGPTRANSKMTMNIVGTGKVTDPSSITAPAVTTEHNLTAGSAAITILGDNYITLKALQEIEFGWQNNCRLDEGFYPGSGTSNGAAIRGRMEFGDRAASLRFRARLRASSPETADLLAQTTGTAVITLTGALIIGSTYHGATVTFHKVAISSAIIGNNNGLATIEVVCRPLKHASNGLITMAVTCAQDNILSASV